MLDARRPQQAMLLFAHRVELVLCELSIRYIVQHTPLRAYAIYGQHDWKIIQTFRLSLSLCVMYIYEMDTTRDIDDDRHLSEAENGVGCT